MLSKKLFLKTGLLAVCILAICLGYGVAQNNPDIKRTMHWYFGFGAGLDFSSGTAVADTTGKANDFERALTMSDTCGNLLFYVSTDSTEYYMIVMDRNHQPMQNGIIAACCNATQIVCVPQPKNDSLYYIFYTHLGISVQGQFKYAIVNMNANGGLGTVVSKDSVLLDSLATEKIAITQHCNGIDFWVASKMRGNWTPIGNLLFVWQLTEIGLNPTPIVSAPGNIGWENGDGYFRFSNHGTMAAVAYVSPYSLYYKDSSYVEIYQFDNCTGIFSNPITIQYAQPYGLIFSPNDSKLYVGSSDGAFIGSLDTAYLTQYDLSNYNQSNVLSTAIILKKGAISSNFQLGLDGKIYIADIDSALPNWGLNKMGVINNPNAQGIACNYMEEQLDLLGRDIWLGLPYFPDNYFKDFNFTNCATNIILNTTDVTIHLYPNPFDDFITINYPADYQLKLIDLTGKLIYQKNITSEYYQLSTSDFKSGIYILNISSKNNNIIKKIIKL